VEDVELAIAELARIDHIEDLAHHECLEDHGVEGTLGGWRVKGVGVNSVIGEVSKGLVLIFEVVQRPELGHEERLFLVVVR
jgi:hypothetical protein